MPVAARRTLAVVAAAAVLIGIAAYLLRDESSSFDPERAATLQEMGDRVGAEPMQLVFNGNYPERTGEILLVPEPHFYLGPEANLSRWGTDEPFLFTSHPNPWDYLARVPIVVRGPGRVYGGNRNKKPVDLTALAPTYARLLQTDFYAQGSTLPGIDFDRSPPKLIFTIVIDGGGWNVLDRYPDSWPNIEKLMNEGLTFENATIGSFPAQTGSIHANIGTGEYPRTHGVPYNFYFENADPRYLERPTIGDVWDRQTNNQAVVGTVSVLSNHLAMIGHGAALEGGDRDIGVVWDDENHQWTTNEDIYELPGYLAMDYDRLERYEAQNDARDGNEDGTWFGNPPEELLEGLRRSSNPAFERYQGDDVLTVIRNESLGLDEVADLFYVQFKSPDQGGHIWNMVNPEIEDILKEADAQIGRIVEALDSQVGRDDYVLVVTADHGQQPVATPEGGWMINASEVERDVEEAFGVEARVRSHQLNITSKASREEIEEISRFLGSYTIGDNIPKGIPGADRVAASLKDDLVFAGAFPTAWLSELSHGDIRRFGPSSYPEGNLLR